ncbi:hypothetical protein [Pseudomonas turukhanskensis]|uniref:Uncharacterized protein n=1 Tax=Pseudomonas turukhanskensis TaxID=1806536 RepID=A0A9W6K8A8_9PSED|nr:hypothetical protein [Pseudomonas turukhanskensis]GLK90018.1 hypothetical protein GCM10017655_30800 [Pseudomonas turukhanskensis]
MPSSQVTRSKRRLIVMRSSPIRLSDFIEHYRQELGCSREEAAFASADILRRLEPNHPQLNIEVCWVAEILDHTAQRETCGIQTARLIRFFELQALSKSKREAFVSLEDASGAELHASDAAVYFSPQALTRLIETNSSHEFVPKFIWAEELPKTQHSEIKAGARDHLRTRELLTVQRLTGALVKMIIGSAKQDEARRVILSSKLCGVADDKVKPFSTAESLTFIADRMGLSGFPDTDTVAKYLPNKQDDS